MNSRAVACKSTQIVPVHVHIVGRLTALSILDALSRLRSIAYNPTTLYQPCTWESMTGVKEISPKFFLPIIYAFSHLCMVTGKSDITFIDCSTCLTVAHPRYIATGTNH